jgi:3-deoxy-7-phosphoheptulonate synthase
MRLLALELIFSPSERTSAPAREGRIPFKRNCPSPSQTIDWWFEGPSMLVVMKAQATPEQIQAVCEHIEQLGFRAHPLPGAQRTAIGITGNKGAVDRGNLEELSGVAEVIRVSKAYKLASRDVKEEDTIIRFPSAGTCPDSTIGGRDLAIIAGPCSIESRDQAFAVAEQVAAVGAQFFRGGAYKPRTSPYAFQGLGLEALRIMAEIRQRYGLRIVTEALDNESLTLVAEWADVVQIGARNMQNFSLLKRAGRLRKPVLLKRGLSATLEEFLMSAEYIMSEGNYQVILCERGVRTFADHTRYTLDLSVVPAVQRLSHLPILVDPSHGTGKRDSVLPMARAAVASGADGILVEVHNQPDKALSDGPQAIYPDQFVRLMDEIQQIAPVVGRHLPRGIHIAAAAG